MKTPIKLLALLAALLCAGCSSLTRMQKFLDQLPATDLSKVTKTSSSPLWSSTATAADISVDADGLLDVGAASVKLKIPTIYYDSELIMEGWKQIPTAKQRAAAAALKAQAKAERAKTAAAKAEAAAKVAADISAKTTNTP